MIFITNWKNIHEKHYNTEDKLIDLGKSTSNYRGGVEEIMIIVSTVVHPQLSFAEESCGVLIISLWDFKFKELIYFRR